MAASNEDAVLFYSGEPERRFSQLMVLPADPQSINMEEQGRLRACVYAFGRSFIETYDEWDFYVADRPEKTCQPPKTGNTQVIDAKDIFFQEAAE
jgi:hypothetical protein